MRWHRWRVVARDVNGREIGELGRSRWEMRARATAATQRAYVPVINFDAFGDPIDCGRPLYLVSTERIEP